MKWLNSLGIAKRFNLLNAAIVLLTAFSIGFIVTYKLLMLQFETRQQYNQALASLLAESSEYGVYAHQHQLLQNQLKRLNSLPGLAYAAILDQQGQTLAELRPAQASASHRQEAQTLIFWPWWVKVGGINFSEIAQPIKSGNFQNEDMLFLSAGAASQTIGHVRIEMDPVYFEEVLINTFLLSLGVVIIILIMSLITFMVLTARITMPLKKFSEVAHGVIEGHMEPITLSSGGPELQELAKAFNLMTNWLKDYRLEVKNYQAILEQQAYYDELTGLANRVLLKDHLRLAMAQANRHQTSVALMFLDLDRFKFINDTLGHSFGDQLLQGVATRLRQQIRADDTVARMGGDEFIIIINDLSSEHEHAKKDAGYIASQIGDSLSRPFYIDGHPINTSFSIGIAFYPRDGEDEEVLTRNADCAMYEAKERGRNTYRFYDEPLQQRSMRRLSLENGLKQALEEQAFSLNFQPKYDMRTGRIMGAEALLRWRYQDNWVSPIEFIPLAEETGLILPIGQWVIETALTKLAYWRSKGIVDANFHVGINVSPQQFWHPGFADQIHAMIERLLPNAGHTVELELTESCLLRSSEQSQHTFHRLKASGVRFAVDDFGTGYSSLSYLKQFPLDILKIDQSFVRDCIIDPSDATIIRAIIAMAKGLGLDVIAEGVETLEHAAFLKQSGCHLLQGYLLAKPLPAKEFAEFCQTFSSHPIHHDFQLVYATSAA
ncbi:EAL domain-containing protein [Methylocucumis oryzae]|uniref:EAL domain-containing protein n=1 Tax=Methylocucumis oryzae TaxID=1632867 RepID=UPI0006961B6E|nr:EAL domain-containing protein [Methylocucumis oryzae]